MFHLRFTPDDISGYTFDFLDTYDKYIVAQEDVHDDGSPLLHYHILVETTYGVKSIRDAAKAALKIPATGRGKNNKYYALIEDWKDPGYICKYNNIIRCKGFSEKEIMEFVISGKKKYLDKVKGTELSGDSVAPAAPSSRTRVSIDKEVIADCITFYELRKKSDEGAPTINELVKEACRVTRSYGKGINMFKIRDYVHAVLFDCDNSEYVVNKISSIV